MNYTHDHNDFVFEKYNPNIWNAVLSLILYSAREYDQSLMLRTTIRYPNIPFPNWNRHIKRFLDSIKQSLKRDGFRVVCLWVKEFGENSEAGNHHFHIWWALEIRNAVDPFFFKPIAEHFWGLAIGGNGSGLVNIDRLDLPGAFSPYGVMFSRDSYDSERIINTVGCKATYLAKTDTKEYYASDDRSWSVSQIPRMPMSDSNRVLSSLCF